MRQSTAIIATLIRLLALCVLVWALIRLVVWAIHPIGIRIYNFAGEESSDFDFADVREIYQNVTYLCFAAGLYLVSLPVARAATADASRSITFMIAYSCIRAAAFCFFSFALLTAFFTLVEIPIDHLRNADDLKVVSFWGLPSFRVREVLNEGFIALTVVPFWLFTKPIARAFTHRFDQSSMESK